MPNWTTSSGQIIVCDDYTLWLNDLGWVPGAMLAYIALHHPELLREFIESVYKEHQVDYDKLILKIPENV